MEYLLGARGCDWKLAKRIVTLDRLKWAVGTFGLYKASGGDGISPILLKKGLKALALPLYKLLGASPAIGYIPKCSP